MVSNRTLGIAALYLAGAIGAVGLSLGASFIPVGAPFASALRIAAPIAACVVAFGFAGAAWNRTDEAAREAHKSAAFWGLPFGQFVGLVALIVAARSSMPRGAWTQDAHTLFQGLMPEHPLFLILLGALAITLASLAGYLSVWAGWWLRARDHRAA